MAEGIARGAAAARGCRDPCSGPDSPIQVRHLGSRSPWRQQSRASHSCSSSCCRGTQTSSNRSSWNQRRHLRRPSSRPSPELPDRMLLRDLGSCPRSREPTLNRQLTHLRPPRKCEPTLKRIGAPAPAATTERAAARAESSSLAAPTGEMPPAQWATLIETLYASGDRAAAAAQLRAFRIEHADADGYLPEALRDWASGKSVETRPGFAAVPL